MDRTTILWTLVLFFAASLLFSTLRRVTADSPTGVVLAVQLGALALAVGLIVLVVRYLRRR